MASKQWLTGAAGALALAAVTGAAQSAPLASVATDFRPATASSVEKAQYRICAMENGVRRCRMAEISGPYRSTGRRVYGYQPLGPRVYGYRSRGPVYGYRSRGPVYGYQPTGPAVYGYQAAPQYGYEFPDQYPVGSGAWWRSMYITDRLGASHGN
jgi:hypothetical protein